MVPLMHHLHGMAGFLAATIILAAGCGDDGLDTGPDETGRTPQETIADFLAATDCEEHLSYFSSPDNARLGDGDWLAECEADPDGFLPINPPTAGELELSDGRDMLDVVWRIDDQERENLDAPEGVNAMYYTVQMQDDRWTITGWAAMTPEVEDAND
jgi:hypothetical protein